ncbi:MAG: CPBP family intramembrane metalloprotease [Bacteroidetes bacterium]|jgi:membrane protease YdiL (CAAX protease family)|nr:CPBP family intramembrane metalloprotease [Bacteroidota bacterium]
MKKEKSISQTLFRPTLSNVFPKAWILALLLFYIHALIRFGGLWNSFLIPLSMIIIWPLPWILSGKEARRNIRLRSPTSWNWLVNGSLFAVVALFFCISLAWLIFGTSENNWFVQHAFMLSESLESIPEGTSLETMFWIVTIPAMIFSPIGEEFLFRGYIQKSLSDEWGPKVGQIVQASAFALVHLAHYGLLPFQPLLILVWVPSMFLTGLVFGWIVQKSGSVWPAVAAHSIFNLGMNAVVFLMLPNLVGV